MPNVTQRELLIFQINKKLPALSSSQLQLVARLFKDGRRSTEGFSAYDFFLDFKRSQRLKAMEDEGIGELLLLRDLLHELKLTDARSDEVGVSTAHMNGTCDIHTHPSSKDNNTRLSPMDIHLHPLPNDTNTHLPSMDMHKHTSPMEIMYLTLRGHQPS